jgi:hypothetical protein
MTRARVSEIIQHPQHNGLYRVSEGAAVAAAVRVRGARLTGKSKMLEAMAEALAFPDYFGANWDALEECLTDLSWHDGGVVLLIDDAATPESRAPDEWGVLLDILADAARHWRDEGRAFSVFLQGSHAAFPLVAA